MFYWKKVLLACCSLGYIADKNQKIPENKTITEGADLNMYMNIHTYSFGYCTIYEPGNPAPIEIEPDWNLLHCTYTVKDVDFNHAGIWMINYGNTKKKINVQVTESLVISVNGDKLPATNWLSNKQSLNKYYSVKHYYNEGDATDIMCISPAAPKRSKNYFVTLKYDFAEALPGIFNTTISSSTGIELRTTLQAAHNNTNVICESIKIASHHYLSKLVNITFLLNPLDANSTKKLKPAGLVDIIKIQFRYSNKNWTDTTLLHLNLPRNKILLDIFDRDGTQLIYYEYEDGERLSVSCSTSPKMDKENLYYLKFNDTVSRSDSFITLNKRLSSVDDNITLICYLRRGHSKTQTTAEKQIKVLLRMTDISMSKKSLKSVNNDRERQSLADWFIVLVVCICICILVCGTVIVYKMRKRNVYEQRDIKEKHEDIYDRSNMAMTTIPLDDEPCSYKSISRSQPPELTYAVLDLFSAAKTSKKNVSETALYSEIYHNTVCEQRNYQKEERTNNRLR